MPAITISQRAIDLIVSCEVSSRGYYEKHYRSPEWPGGASGVTIGIGYDLGYASLAKERADWSAHCTEDELRVMDRCLGVHGAPARSLLPSVKSKIDIGWDAATSVFLERDVPQWTVAVCKAVPGADRLSPDCLGALVSIAYNRGASFNAAGDRYREMRDIRAHVIAGQLDNIPGDIRAMKRLWPAVRGLRDRRDAEAKLFENGLKVPSIIPAKPVASEKPAAALPPKPVGIQENGSSGAAGAGIGKAIHDSVPAAHVWSFIDIALAVGGVIAVMAVVWIGIRWYRASQPTLAREKDQPMEKA